MYVVQTMMFKINLEPKWRFDVDIIGSADPSKWILK
jgi:hypothetical protein